MAAKPAAQCRYRDIIPWGNVTEHFEWRPESNRLGEGTYGSVSKAKCCNPRGEEGMQVGEWYAVKVIRKERLRDEKHWRAVIHEIEILRRIRSQYCIRLYDAFQSETSVYLVLEYIDGGELFDFIIKRGHLTEHEARQITCQLLEALRYLHCDQKIVHRDLKPENILMVKDKMQIKIIDFGFAKFFGQASEHPYPVTPNPTLMANQMGSLSPGATIPNTPSELILNTPLGSLKYCAPEILKRLVNYGIEARVTTRIDIQKLDMFAAGVVTYVMLGGSFPFSSKSRHALAIQIERGIKFPEARFADVSEDAKDFCRMMLNPDRKKRPLSYEAFNHRWLRIDVPNTPLEIWEHGQPDPMDNELFDEIRDIEEKMGESGEGQAPPTNATVVPPRPKQTVELKPPKKLAAKRPPAPSTTPTPCPATTSVTEVTAAVSAVTLKDPDSPPVASTQPDSEPSSSPTSEVDPNSSNSVPAAESNGQ